MDSHGAWIATPRDLVRFVLHVDGFGYQPSLLSKNTINVMTTPCPPIAPNYAKGWFVNSAPNWWHEGYLPGTVTIVVRTASGMAWAAFTNTRSDGMVEAIDDLMWNMAKSVPAWQAA
jgi:hypothetical protein